MGRLELAFGVPNSFFFQFNEFNGFFPFIDFIEIDLNELIEFIESIESIELIELKESLQRFLKENYMVLLPQKTNEAEFN